MKPTNQQPLDLGWLDICLNVKDIKISHEFYLKLGFGLVDGKLDKGWAVMTNGEARIALYQGHINEFMLNFRGGDIEKIAAELKARGLDMEVDVNLESDGSKSATLRDPDGNMIYLNTHPDEVKL